MAESLCLLLSWRTGDEALTARTASLEVMQPIQHHTQSPPASIGTEFGLTQIGKWGKVCVLLGVIALFRLPLFFSHSVLNGIALHSLSLSPYLSLALSLSVRENECEFAKTQQKPPERGGSRGGGEAGRERARKSKKQRQTEREIGINKKENIFSCIRLDSLFFLFWVVSARSAEVLEDGSVVFVFLGQTVRKERK